MPAPSLPTGNCQYRLLDKEFTCGCQWFRPKRRKNLNDACADEDDECRCGHDACFHKFEPVRGHAPAPTGRLSVTTSLDDTAAAFNPAALSSISGTTTEREPSTSCTPSTAATMLKPSFPKLIEAPQSLPLHSAPGPSSQQTKRQQKAPVQQRQSRAPPPSSSLSAAVSKNEMYDVRAQLKNLIDATIGLKSNQMSHHDRIETIEGLPAALEDLSEKIELLDQGIDERHYSFEMRFESRLDEKLDERLAPLEGFIKSRNERKRKRRQAKRDFESVENSSSIRGDRKKRPRTGNEPHSQPRQFGITRTTTTSFTTTTSTSTSFSASSPVFTRADDVQALKFQLDQLKNRVTDVEVSGPPSAMRPWEVEVVLIPPSILLHGAWQDVDSSVSSTQHTGSSELGPLASALPRTLPSPALTGVMPRSFSQNSKTYCRLASRGFVRRLHITGPTAREAAIAVENFFLHLLAWCASFTPASGTSQQNAKSQYSGTTDSQRTTRGGRRPVASPWQPLRKVYKQTALEYIPPADLVTPSLWTVDYLKANCMMRSSQRRVLYIMPMMSPVPIKWEDVRQLEPFVDYDPVTGQEKPVGDEAVWEYDFRLDGRVAKERQSILESFVSENFAGEELAKTSFKSVAGADGAGGQVATPPDTAPLPHLKARTGSGLNSTSTPQTAEGEPREMPKNQEGRMSPSIPSTAKSQQQPLSSACRSAPIRQPQPQSRPEQSTTTKKSPISTSTSQSTNCPSEKHGRSSLSALSAPPSLGRDVNQTAGWDPPEPEGHGELGDDEEWGEDVLALFEDVEEGATEEVAIVGGIVGGSEVPSDPQEQVVGEEEDEDEDEDEDELLLPPLPPLQQQVSGLSDTGVIQDSGDGGYVSD